MAGEVTIACANQRSRASRSMPLLRLELRTLRHEAGPLPLAVRPGKRSGRLLAKADTSIWSRPAFAAFSRMPFMRASGANGLPFSMPSAASSPYIGRNFSTSGSASMISCSFSQYWILSSQRRQVPSISFSVMSTNVSSFGLAAVASG